jgi:MYXO-CTERM domain-containing protein
MARAPLLLALCALVVALPGAQADHAPISEEGIDHLNLKVEDIGPGESHALEVLSLDHGGLRPGWIYLIYGYVQGNASLDVAFRHEHEGVTATWRWDPWTFAANTTKVRHEGRHEVILTNNGDESVLYAFYYDQSCNCAGKVIPLPGGVVLFNNMFPAGHTVNIAYPLLAGWHLYGALATHDETKPTASWPEDFEILAETEARGPAREGAPVGWLNFTFEPAETRMHYVYLKALAGADPDDPVLLSPVHDVTAKTADTDEESPAPWLLLPIAAVGLAALLRRRAPSQGGPAAVPGRRS